MTTTLTEQRRQVLQMLAAGQITTDEAEQLLGALQPETPPHLPPGTHSLTKDPAAPRYLRVVVESADRFGGEGPGKVNVRVPVKLLRAGVKLASVLPPWAVDYANAALTKKGLNFDLNQIRPSDVEELIEQLDDVTVQVDQPDVKVHLFSE
jgi:hypothetical protein